MTGNVLLPGARERAWSPGDDFERRQSGLWVPPEEVPAPRPVAIEFFAGAGGFSLGVKQAGFHVAAANEWDTAAAHTYLVNLGGPGTRIVFCTREDELRWEKDRKHLEKHHAKPDRPSLDFGSGWIAHQEDVEPCEVFFFGDVCALTGEVILHELGRESDDIALVFGGPPCQGFSRAGRRDPNDDRNELVFEFMRLVCEIHPRAFAMENVPGMLDMVTRDGIPVIDALAMMAEEGGMGSFEALRRSLLESAGVGAALRTRKAGASKQRPGSSAPRHRLDIDEEATPEDDQLDIFAAIEATA